MQAMKAYGGRELSASRPGCFNPGLYVLENRGIELVRLGCLDLSLVTVPTELSPQTVPVLSHAFRQLAVSSAGQCTGTAAGQAVCANTSVQRAQNERGKGSPVCLLHYGRS